MNVVTKVSRADSLLYLLKVCKLYCILLGCECCTSLYAICYYISTDKVSSLADEFS